ncbi:putative DNA-binding transcriptional regulator [Xenorhabdus nematophila]|uniref:Complete genome segment 16/17 n=1 Tax=Xenorhabdus nematophila (strain ATCC 19061 / DSM 3370 / CCUG 14189 / LMG 1036 / NCIMB 9965 / AN6) TaxID=406817 RepID=D3VIL2_XENNA|nr:DNA-binding protein [Xenorhabdus nematophila]CEE94819.1 Complete genome; segment 16/17 [Xenorhabdus nematophila str. Anatoliense]CEF31544.1 Complete genome; segment 16/17 [Xenorhabdus nematophila str. Websteri]AYA41318.1 DNA-binding protein [Xenorhabdus nematophila]KHD29818.1 DNA-binding protein [Xenorhabdus nematophila]MBA0020055.1 putative DNA-binding transcriptional regulator [Xenorhabdus nematophila]
MKKEWYSAKELIGLAGLPSSPQGVNLMARREGWEQRRKRGVQGKALEYNVNSFPEDVFNVLTVSENTVEYYRNKRQDPFMIWVEAYYQLTKPEREQMVKFILRKGLASLVQYLGIQETGIQEIGSKDKRSIPD